VPTSTDYTGVYFCTDEDIYSEVQDDYFRLLPDSHLLALGTDGIIAAASPWALTSASNDFAAQLVQPGDVFRLGGSATGNVLSPAALALGRMRGGPNYQDGDAGRAFAVDSVDAVDAHTVHLRIPGGVAGEGLPPVRADVSDIIFRCGTLRTQIQASSDRVRQDLDFDAASDIISPVDIRIATVYHVLSARYRARASFYGQSKDDFSAKSAQYDAMYKQLRTDLYARRQSRYAVDDLPIVPIDILPPNEF
jgi:hypothetical protein